MRNLVSKLLIVIVFGGAQAFAQTKQLPIEEFKLKNGLEVKMIRFGTIPAVQINCFINVGRKTENPGQQLMASMTATGLKLGNENYTRINQDNLISKLGSSIGSSSNDNFTSLGMLFLEKDTKTAMDLFSSVLLKPLFPADEIKQEIEQTLNYNNPAKMDIGMLSSVFSEYVVYGTAHPLGRHFYATQLNKITSAQLMEFYKFNYTPKNTQLVVAGNFDFVKMKAEIERLFGSWTAAFGENNGAAYEFESIGKKEYYLINKNKASQTSLQWNKKGPAGGSKDALLFQLANNAFNEILFDEIRAKEGKTYGISSGLNEQDNNGIYSISTQVRNEVAYQTIVSFDRVLKQFYETGINQEQLDKAKARLRNRRLAIESPAEVIAFYNPVLYKDITKRNEYLAMLDAITLDQVNKILKKYFNPDAYKLVLAGDAMVLDEQLKVLPGLVKLSVQDIQKDN